MMKVHRSISIDRLVAMAERRDNSLDNPGVCIACGEEQDGCEPDAREYECEHCGKHKVYAPEELLLSITW